jgi:hypothetical protein
MDFTLDVGAAILSSISIIVSGVIGVFTYSNERRRDKEKQDDAKKAILVPEVIHYQSMSGGKVTLGKSLIIKNYGQGIARDVKILIDGKELSQQKSNYLGPKVISYIAPSAHFDIAFYVVGGDVAYHDVTVTWVDDFKKDNCIVSAISVV